MVLITGRQRLANSPLRIDLIQIISRLVTLAVFILELIAELQESGAGYRFAVSQLCTLIVVLGRSSDVLVTNQDGVSSQSIQ